MSNETFNKKKWFSVPPVLAGVNSDIGDVQTSQQELREMAQIIDRAGEDAVEFLHLVVQDAESLGVTPTDVYDERHHPADDWSYEFDPDEAAQLERVCRATCDSIGPRPESPDDLSDAKDRLEELHLLLSVAIENEIPVTLHQA